MVGVSQAEFARQIGKTKQYVGKLVRQGKINLDAEGLIDPVAARAALKINSDPARTKDVADDVRESPAGADELNLAGSDGGRGGGYSQAATQHKNVQTKMAELAYAQKAGMVVAKADVDREAFDVSRMVRERLMSLPQEVAGALVGMTNEQDIKVFLRNKIRDALMETALHVDPDARSSS